MSAVYTPSRGPSQWLTKDEFRRLHRQHVNSDGWKQFRRRFLEHAGYRCAVCGFDYASRGHSKWQLNVDHRFYWKDGRLIFGRETFADVRCLCPDHHLKGVRDEYSVGQHRGAYRSLKAVRWILRALGKGLRLAYQVVVRRRRREVGDEHARQG